MGRPPCYDKAGIKKGPWSSEEDTILVSYIQEHGPRNWRSVPAKTGLLRCGKSCRLRWTNYLRPGIRIGNFTPHEEGIIIHLQNLLGNKWTAIASHLPQRTDNDIKNYWNTHLKKRMENFQTGLESLITSNSRSSQLHSKNCSETISSSLRSCTYASSIENISRLLEGWMKSTPKPTNALKKAQEEEQQSSNEKTHAAATENQLCHQPKAEEESCYEISQEELENLHSFENLSKMAWEKTSKDSTTQGYSLTDGLNSMTETKEMSENRPPYSFIEKWLLDDATAQVEYLMNLSLDSSKLLSSD